VRTVLEFVAIIMVGATLASIFLYAKFMISLRREAPHIHESLTGKDERSFLGKPVLPFLKMFLLRGYRRELAEYPVSRAWASWLSMARLIMVGAGAVMIVVVLGRHVS
jgi:hypothetical protein